jgi:hypothetical protein
MCCSFRNVVAKHSCVTAVETNIYAEHKHVQAHMDQYTEKLERALIYLLANHRNRGRRYGTLGSRGEESPHARELRTACCRVILTAYWSSRVQSEGGFYRRPWLSYFQLARFFGCDAACLCLSVLSELSGDCWAQK